MIKKMSLIGIADNLGVTQVKVIHHYMGFHKKTSKVGEFVKVSVRKRKYNYSWVKNKRMYVPRKGKKLKAYIVRARYRHCKEDGTTIFFTENSSVVLKSRMSIKGKYVRGPFIYGLRRKKVIASFAGLV